MLIKRTLSRHLSQFGTEFPVVYVGGARQVGKSTLLRQSLPEATYVTLDAPEIRTLALHDPRIFLARYKPPVIIDEIQYAPSLFPYLKMAVDPDRKPGMYWLSGSQPFHLLKNVSESLAGRVAIVDMLGLSTREIFGEPDAPPLLDWLPVRGQRKAWHTADIFTRIWRGSYPELHVNPTLAPDRFYASYIRTYLERDVRDLARVGDEQGFLAFLRLVAARTGQLLNINGLARDADISHGTAKAWLSILETSGIIVLLMPYHANPSKRLVKAPKLYVLDTGLAAWLAGWGSPEALERGASAGAFLETYVVSEVIKSYWHTGQRPWMYFYRDRDDHEIDLVLLRDGKLYPLEVKVGSRPDVRTTRQMDIAQKFGLSQGHGAIVCRTDIWFPLTETVDAVPVGLV